LFVRRSSFVVQSLFVVVRSFVVAVVVVVGCWLLVGDEGSCCCVRGAITSEIYAPLCVVTWSDFAHAQIIGLIFFFRSTESEHKVFVSMALQVSDLNGSSQFSGRGGGGAMKSVYTIQGSASPKAHRDAEDEIADLQKSFVGLLGHQQGQNLFRMIQEAPQTFANDDRPMVQRLVNAIEKYRAG